MTHDIKNLVYDKKHIQGLVENIAAKLNANFTFHKPIFLGVLNGCIPFFGDLIKLINFEFEIDFIQVKSYKGIVQEEIKFLKHPSIDIFDRDVILIDEYIDSGKTLQEVILFLKRNNVKSVLPVSLLCKENNVLKDTQMVTGEKVTHNHFFYGYGLDLNGKYRNLENIYKI